MTFGIDAGRQSEVGVCVPQIVEPDAGQRAAADQALKDPLTESGSIGDPSARQKTRSSPGPNIMRCTFWACQ
jgi:hypothetical protein